MAGSIATPLTALPANDRERRLALGVAVASMLVFAALAPFAKVPVGRIDAFIPVYQTALVVTDIVTMALLLGVFRTARSQRVFVLACAYLFTALLTVAHTLSFPGLFAPRGLLAAGEQTTAWLYVMWHTGFPLFALAYMALPERPLDRRGAAAWLAGTVLVAAALILLATRGEALLPAVMSGDRYRNGQPIVFGVLWTFSLAALVAAWRRNRGTVIDWWVVVVLAVWFCEIGLAAVLNAGRFDLGFYAGRTYGLLAGSFLLLLLLVEYGVLNARLGGIDRALAVSAERDAADRLINAVMTQLPEGVLIATGGRLVFANRPAQQLLGTGIRRGDTVDAVVDAVGLLRPDSAPIAREDHPLLRAARGESFLAEEFIVPTEDGSRLVAASGRPVVASDGTEFAAVVTFADVTERRRLEAQLQQRVNDLAEADRQKNDFLAMLGHELRNPLAPMTNAVHLMKRAGADAPAAGSAHAMIERQLEHMVRLVDDLLDVSRIIQGKIALRLEPMDLAQALRRAVETSQPVIDAHGHVLEVEAPPAPVFVMGDLIRIAQVISNLLANAAKYSTTPGVIRVKLAREGSSAVLSVHDEGAGIPAELLPKLFDLFVQGEHTLARSQGGLGIGLTLARRIVEMHKGTIFAASEGAGRGSVFAIRLPVLEGALADAAPGAPGAESHSCSRVLVVDDNVDAAESCAEVLRVAGHTVRTAHDGPSALAAAAEFAPDAVLLDIGLPGMDGYEVAERLRADPRLCEVLIVAVTGYGQADDRARARSAGFDHHVVKPADPAHLDRLLKERRAGTSERTGAAG